MFNIIMIVINVIAFLVSISHNLGMWLYAVTFFCSLAAYVFGVFLSKSEFFTYYEHTPVIIKYSLVGCGVLNILSAFLSLWHIFILKFGFLPTMIFSPFFSLMVLAPFINIYYVYYKYTHSE
jgi:hypothetical protein